MSKLDKELNMDRILITGFARLPEKSVLFNKYNGAIEIAMIVERKSGMILDLVSEDLSHMQVDYLRDLLVGKEILDDAGMEEIEQLLTRNYHSSLRKPFYSGIRACRQKLEEMREDDRKRIAHTEETYI